VSSCILQYAKEKPSKSTEFDPESKKDLENLVGHLINLNESYLIFKQKRVQTGTKKIQKSQMNKKKKENIKTEKSVTSA
jgi:uncharacterized Zn finger protein